MKKRIEFKVGNNIHTYHYEGEGDYALIICHGGGGWGGMYDTFALPLREKSGADVWSFDCPGFGQSGRGRGLYTIDEFDAALDAVIAEIREHHSKPIFILGSSMGGMLASLGFYKDEIAGVVIQASPLAVSTPWWQGVKQMLNNPAMDGFLSTPFGQHTYISLDGFMDLKNNYGDSNMAEAMENNLMHTDQVKLGSLASFFNYEPAFPLTENEKPFLYLYAERDPMFTQDAAEATWQSISGPKERHIFDSDKHQLMLCHTDEFVEVMDSWIKKTA